MYPMHLHIQLDLIRIRMNHSCMKLRYRHIPTYIRAFNLEHLSEQHANPNNERNTNNNNCVRSNLTSSEISLNSIFRLRAHDMMYGMQPLKLIRNAKYYAQNVLAIYPFRNTETIVLRHMPKRQINMRRQAKTETYRCEIHQCLCP